MVDRILKSTLCTRLVCPNSFCTHRFSYRKHSINTVLCLQIWDIYFYLALLYFWTCYLTFSSPYSRSVHCAPCVGSCVNLCALWRGAPRGPLSKRTVARQGQRSGQGIIESVGSSLACSLTSPSDSMTDRSENRKDRKTPQWCLTHPSPSFSWRV